MKTTIAFTVYDREDYFKQVLESWSEVRNIENYNFVFKIEISEKLNKILDIIESFKNKTSSLIGIIVNDPKSGVGVNHYEALYLCFEELNSDLVIMAEDDVIVSEDILEYFDYVFKKYKNDEEILTVCSHRYVETNSQELLIKEQSFDPWIWGTWKTKWKKYLKNDWDLEKFSLEGRLVGGFDYHIVYKILPKYNLKSIFPSTTRSKHIGVEGTYATADYYFDNPYFIKKQPKNFFGL